MEFTALQKSFIDNCILAWLATASKDGQPNVSPKEIFTYSGSNLIWIANISSPQSFKNITQSEKVCISILDPFKQKGFKFYGIGRVLKQSNFEFVEAIKKLYPLAGERFPFNTIFEIQVTSAKTILAPSYQFYSDTNEETMIDNAMKQYGVKPLNEDN